MQDKKSNLLLKEITPNALNVVAQESELEKRKKELAEKRQLYKPEDSNNYKVQKSSFTYKILEEERVKKEEKLAQDKIKHDLYERKQRYSKLVQDVFAPKLKRETLC